MHQPEHELQPAGGAEFVKYVGAVLARGLRSNAEVSCDFLVAHAARERLDRLEFTRRQGVTAAELRPLLV